MGNEEKVLDIIIKVCPPKSNAQNSELRSVIPIADLAPVIWGYSFNSEYDTVLIRVKGRLVPQTISVNEGRREGLSCMPDLRLCDRQKSAKEMPDLRRAGGEV